ncbi:prephenate dehydratase [Aureibacter tunicatorum]|uniref:Bifunctional chorismate mutase/prephenate dehydratase n=1 Tax=Aureibacter tunicatorum TaxID=866807 RepID=A0AAE3XLX2_9BACT|nr:prephenate dehydratase [Aureibacter tunicatorum]MDR6237349.1 chorismate mutase/prephenate dehydratase [Aureibacter tunicatorum]BDD06340.1 chorismate mutase [Aureibacter tunicatorum]
MTPEIEKAELAKLRDEIDAIDNQLLQLINNRMDVVRRVGELKKANNTVIYRPEREKSIIDRLDGQNNGLLNKSAIEAIFLEIFAISRNLELPEKIAYLGPESSFTHQAAESRFGAMSEYLPISSITKVFEAVDTGRARYGVVPIENNQEGIVSETIDLLGQFDLSIVAEIAMPIHFAFGSKHNSIKEIKKVYSRDIAFLQCKNFIAESFGENVELVPVNSTSRAVKLALEEEGAAALCPKIAAKQAGLPILFENVEDSEDNFTRFLILAKDFINQKSGNDKTTILAQVSNEPGALANLLQGFYDAGINLTKIESRPAKKGKNFSYQFFIDFDGHFNDENAEKVLTEFSENIKCLGSYVKMC